MISLITLVIISATVERDDLMSAVGRSLMSILWQYLTESGKGRWGSSGHADTTQVMPKSSRSLAPRTEAPDKYKQGSISATENLHNTSKLIDFFILTLLSLMINSTGVKKYVFSWNWTLYAGLCETHTQLSFTCFYNDNNLPLSLERRWSPN